MPDGPAAPTAVRRQSTAAASAAYRGPVSSYCRANDIDEHVFSRLKRAGLAKVFVGVESGVDAALIRYRKHVTSEQNLRALAILDDLGIQWDIGFIIYDPHSTFQELKENTVFVRKNRFYRFNAATLLLNGMVVFPGTPIETQLADEGRLLRDVQAAVEFMGAKRDAVGYDDALHFVNQTYTLDDPLAEQARQMIDIAYQRLTPIYDTIWPSTAEFERWLERHRNGGLENGIEACGEVGNAYRALVRSIRNIGVLTMNLLETIVEFVETKRNVEEFISELEQRIAVFWERAYPGGITSAVSIIQDFLAGQPTSRLAASETRYCDKAFGANEAAATRNSQELGVPNSQSGMTSCDRKEKCNGYHRVAHTGGPD
jgi:hypothetical protein